MESIAAGQLIETNNARGAAVATTGTNNYLGALSSNDMLAARQQDNKNNNESDEDELEFRQITLKKGQKYYG